MPAAGAHYQFGQMAQSQLEPPLMDFLTRNQAMFQLGVQGPDLLFFYRPLSKNGVSHQGHILHSRSGGDLLGPLMASRPSWSPALTAYLMGVCCHYALDRTCHPLINQLAPTSREHQAMESAFDRLVLGRYGVTLHRHRLLPRRVDVEALCTVYPEFSPKQLKESADSIRRYNHLLEYGSLVKFGEKLLHKQGGFSEMCLPDQVMQDSLAHQIFPLFHQAVDEAVQLMTLLHQSNIDQLAIHRAMPYNFEGILVYPDL